MTADELITLKKAFAKALLRSPDDPMKAAFAAIPDTGLACQAAFNWRDDPIVKAEQIELLDEFGQKGFLPTKDEQAKDVYKMAQNETLDEEIRLKAHRLYAEIMGNIDKPAAATTNVNVVTSTVMVVKDHGSDEEWEQRAVAQQRALINGDTGNVISAGN